MVALILSMRAKNRLSFVTIVTGVWGGQADLGCVERNCSLLVYCCVMGLKVQ